MTRFSDDRKRLQGALDKLRARFAKAARAYEKDDHAAAAEETHGLLNDIDEFVDDHCKTYPQALKEQRLSFLLESRREIDARGDEKPHAATLLKHLIRTEKALHLLQGEIRRAYPGPSLWNHVWKIRKPLFITMGSALLVLLLWTTLAPRHGLIGEYYEGADFQKLVKRRIDRNVDFDWGFSGPAGLTDYFSARWSGFLLVPRDGNYEFLVRSDDGERLWINDKLVIDHWELHSESNDRAKVILEKGPNSIRLEYFEYTRRATVQLFWRPDGESDDRIIPPNNLVPTKRDIPAS